MLAPPASDFTPADVVVVVVVVDVMTAGGTGAREPSAVAGGRFEARAPPGEIVPEGLVFVVVLEAPPAPGEALQAEVLEVVVVEAAGGCPGAAAVCGAESSEVVITRTR